MTMKRVALAKKILALNQLLNLEEIGNAPLRHRYFSGQATSILVTGGDWVL